MKNVVQEREKSIAGAINVDEKEIKEHLNGIVRQTVEETLNSLLNAEADAICNAGRYQRSLDRLDTRAGAYPSRFSEARASTAELHRTGTLYRFLSFRPVRIREVPVKIHDRFVVMT
ncbi:MAG: hypothetical protein BWY31_01282 [Lentisphaerae bacterium ADurb.Bin242]|nr:MAG: hypothetical protein BWY31_01282 [Lentisphaerae bacterium ADurb.Bin242]